MCCSLLFCACSNQEATEDQRSNNPFAVIAIGDVGEPGSDLRANSQLLANMLTQKHDAGQFDAMIFLGDNFYNTGLNVRADEVDGLVKDVLGPFKISLEALGRKNVHAIAGNHDYYARNAFETSALFGLIDIQEGPIGLTDKGNKRASALKQWTYYYGMPAEVCYPTNSGLTDSVQFIFVDSALPLRTNANTWTPALDSLRKLLRASAARKGITWRILCMHHPMYSVGEHAGFSEWNDETNTVEYLTQCDKDSNAVGWMKNWFDPEDLCAEKYGAFMDSLKGAINETGVRIQAALTGHEHSLQLLNYQDRDRDCEGCPKIHIVSGAGSKSERVKFPSPPIEFTAANTTPSKEGISAIGFARLIFSADSMRVTFFNARTIAPQDMGGGMKEFTITPDGRLTNVIPPKE